MRGQKLRIKTNRNYFEGLFFSVDAFDTVMRLTDVVLIPSGEKIEGFSSVRKSDIIFGKFVCQHTCVKFLTFL